MTVCLDTLFTLLNALRVIVSNDMVKAPPMANIRVKSLTTIDDLGTEMRRVYRLVRREEMDMVRGKGLIYILGQIVSVTRDSDLEKRIEELEAQL